MKNKAVKVFDLAGARHKSRKRVRQIVSSGVRPKSPRIDWADVSAVLGLIEITRKRTRQNNAVFGQERDVFQRSG